MPVRPASTIGVPAPLTSLHRRRPAALARGGAVVALESSVLAQGLAPPFNREAARTHDARGRRGRRHARHHRDRSRRARRSGSMTTTLERFLARDGVRKVSARDLAMAIADGADGATTVAGTLALCALAGIEVFATGGIGGVHRDAPFDESADLPELARTQRHRRLRRRQVDSRPARDARAARNPRRAGRWLSHARVAGLLHHDHRAFADCVGRTSRADRRAWRGASGARSSRRHAGGASRRRSTCALDARAGRGRHGRRAARSGRAAAFAARRSRRSCWRRSSVARRERRCRPIWPCSKTTLALAGRIATALAHATSQH